MRPSGLALLCTITYRFFCSVVSFVRTKVRTQERTQKRLGESSRESDPPLSQEPLRQIQDDGAGPVATHALAA